MLRKGDTKFGEAIEFPSDSVPWLVLATTVPKGHYDKAQICTCTNIMNSWQIDELVWRVLQETETPESETQESETPS